MGNWPGHVFPGVGFLLMGLWQLYNHIKLHCQRPKTYKPPVWFPAPKVRRLELYLILFCSFTQITTELFVGPSHHQPLDPDDWTIPPGHLKNFEHATICLSIFIYAAFALRFDKVPARSGQTVTLLAGAAAFAVEFLMFYLHSTDHAGLEGQYHRLLLAVITALLVTTLMGIGYPCSFAVGFTRSVCLVLQGVWFNMVGIMLYAPWFTPKGCHLQTGDGTLIVPCDDHASLHRAKALVNLQFAWSLAAVVVFSAWLYLRMSQKYPEVPEHEFLGKEEGQQADVFVLESPKKNRSADNKSESIFP
ncbi:hypothetical protein Taro_054359 [Colocasia esculenta]|uniref:Transmembrane protein 45B n=1 Tax=Colocasia esculenta TaxID=4460 RepID=A0A843XQG0_COLES|nr:hypothetical protein [Colocasia esculenta]